MRIIARVSLVLGLAACAKADQPAKVEQRHDSVSGTVAAKAERLSVVFVGDSESPRLVIDSAAKEPVLELLNGEFVVRLPLDMARLLADSLPDFTPIKRAAFDKNLVSWRDHYADRRPTSLDPADSDGIWESALSVVVGDFNGDSRRDVAMEGLAGDTYAVFFLLSAPDAHSSPALVYFHPPHKGSATPIDGSFINYLTLIRPGKVGGFTEEGDPPVLDLRRDAVEYSAYEKGSEIYYIDKGVVQIFTTSD